MKKMIPILIFVALILALLSFSVLGLPTYSVEYTPPVNNIDNIITDQYGLHIFTQQGTINISLFVNNNRILVSPDLVNRDRSHKFGWQFNSNLAGQRIPVRAVITSDFAFSNIRCVRENLCDPVFEKDGFVLDFYDIFDLGIENMTVSSMQNEYTVEFNYTVPQNGIIDIDPSVYNAGTITVSGTGNTCETIATQINNNSIFSWVSSSRECWLMANLNISGQLILENLTFHNNVTTNGQYDINVTGGGNLTLINATITNNNIGTIKYSVIIHGNFTMKDSTVKWAGWNANFADTRGLEIYTPVHIYNSTLHDNKIGATFYGSGSNSRIEDSNITTTSNTIRGIYLAGSTSSHAQNILMRNIDMPNGIDVDVWLTEARNNSIIGVRGKCLDDGLIIQSSQDIGGTDANNNQIINSTFSGSNDCERGIDIIGSSSGHLIAGNLIENITGALNATNRLDYGIRIQAGTNIRLENNIIRYVGESGSNEQGHGIYITSYTADTTKEAGNITVENNTLRFIGSSGFLGQGNVIYSLSGNNHVVTGNVINDSLAGSLISGIFIATGSGHIISQNTVSSNSFGQIRLNLANNTQIIKNTATGDDGIVVSNSNIITISHNTLVNNFIGVQVDGENMTVSYNNFTGNTIPISLESERNTIAEFNTVDDNDIINFGGELQTSTDRTNDVLVKDTTVRNSGSVQLYWDYEEWDCQYGGDATVLNTSYSSISFCAGTWIKEPSVTIKWHLDIGANYSNGNPVQNANITVYNNTLQKEFSILTGSNGRAFVSLAELKRNTTSTIFYNNYTINATDNRCQLSQLQSINTTQSTSIGFTFQDCSVTNETLARQAIEQGINNALTGHTIITDQQLYTKNNAGSQTSGSFDKVVIKEYQRWGFNYLTGNEALTNVNSLGTTYNIWENQSLTYNEIVNQVETYINSTKI